MNYRFATVRDATLLAPMNSQLIRDEGHRNTMSIPELEERMARWLRGEYQAVIIEEADVAVGYALFQREPDWIYLRQFFITPERRRTGIATRAIAWLLENAWNNTPRIRLDVLVGNAGGIAFWRSQGFADYCLTMEKPVY